MSAAPPRSVRIALLDDARADAAEAALAPALTLSDGAPGCEGTFEQDGVSGGARAYRRYLSTHMYEELAGIEVFDQACALVQTNEQLTG